MTIANPQEQQARLEEYRELRAEMRGYLTNGHYNRNFAFIITLGVFGAATALPLSGLVFFGAAVLVGLLWLSDVDKLRAIFRVSTYLELFVEPEIPGLEWETTVGRNQKLRKSFWRPIVGRADFMVLYCLHSGIATYHAYDRGLPLALACAGFLIAFFIPLVWNTHAVWHNGRFTERNVWVKIIAENKRMEDGGRQQEPERDK